MAERAKDLNDKHHSKKVIIIAHSDQLRCLACGVQIDVLKADRHCTAAAHSAKAAAHPGDQRQAFSRSNNQQPSAALPASAESEAPLHVHVEHVADSGDARGGHPHEKNPRQAVDLFWTSSGSVIDADHRTDFA